MTHKAPCTCLDNEMTGIRRCVARVGDTGSVGGGRTKKTREREMLGGRGDKNVSADWKHNGPWITGGSGRESKEDRHQRGETQEGRMTNKQLFSRKIVGRFFKKLKENYYMAEPFYSSVD